MGKQMLDLVGTLALFLWGIRMVKTGMSRAFGVRLRRWIAAATSNRLMAFGVGLVTTVVLQSSSTTGLIMASFAGGGFVSAAMAQAVMLGANVGASLVPRLLAFANQWPAPLLIAVGVVAFTFSETKPSKGMARAALGLGLMLLSTHLLGQASAPMRQSETLLALMAALAAVPILAVIVAAVLAIASSSSLVVVLFVMSLAATGAVGGSLAIALVLGANIGGAVAPVIATLGDGPLARRVTLGNFLARLLGCGIALPFADVASSLVSQLSANPAALVVNAHVVFNILLAALMLPCLAPFSWAMQRLLPEARHAVDGPCHLNAEILDKPAMALAAAARETLRIGDYVASMLESNLEALRKNDSKRCASLKAMEEQIDKLNSAVKLYLAKLSRTALVEKNEKRSAEIVTYATNLKHIGDIVDNNLRKLVEKKIKNQLAFPSRDAVEIEQLYKVTIDNLGLAQSILVSGDEQLARQLVEAKMGIRYLEESSTANHLRRLRDGQVESVQTSSLHLDILCDLERINVHLAAIAHPILRQAGALYESRLVELGIAPVRQAAVGGVLPTNKIALRTVLGGQL
jgi:phosphate:Na+ symporter